MAYWLLGNLADSYEVRFKHKETGVTIDIFLLYPMEQEDTYYAVSFYGVCDSKEGGFCKWKYIIRGTKTVSFAGAQ